MTAETSITAALVDAQKSVSNVLTDTDNEFFKGHKYASLAAVRDAVIPAFNEAGIAVIQSPSTDESGAVFVRTILMHGDATLEFESPHVSPVKADAQGVGSCITYLRRYTLMALAGVAPEDDDGNAASRGNGDRKAENGAEIKGTAPGGRQINARRGNTAENHPKTEIEICRDEADRIRNAIYACTTVQAVNDLLAKESGTLERIKNASVKAHGNLMERAENRKGDLSQADPSRAAAE